MTNEEIRKQQFEMLSLTNSEFLEMSFLSIKQGILNLFRKTKKKRSVELVKLQDMFIPKSFFRFRKRSVLLKYVSLEIYSFMNMFFIMRNDYKWTPNFITQDTLLSPIILRDVNLDKRRAKDRFGYYNFPVSKDGAFTILINSQNSIFKHLHLIMNDGK